MDRTSPRASPKSGSPAQDVQREAILRKAFDVYDEDGSGSIDYDELRKLLQDLGWPSHDEFLRRSVRVLDEDGSGEIEFSEFLKWTEFAYASRILYRREMYGAGPRYPFADDVELQTEDDLAKKKDDGPRSLIIRRASLTTVHEGQEAKFVMSEPDSDDVDVETETPDGADISSPACASKARNEESHGAQGRVNVDDDTGPCEVSNRAISAQAAGDALEHNVIGPMQNEKQSIQAGATGSQAVRREEYSTPIMKMATMVLGTRGRNRVHTSRARSKSVGILIKQKSRRGDLEYGSSSRMGPRTESKMTVRMRWACGQFSRGDQSDDSGNNSTNQYEERGTDTNAATERDSSKMTSTLSCGLPHGHSAIKTEAPLAYRQHSEIMKRNEDGGKQAEAADAMTSQLRRVRSD